MTKKITQTADAIGIICSFLPVVPYAMYLSGMCKAWRKIILERVCPQAKTIDLFACSNKYFTPQQIVQKLCQLFPNIFTIIVPPRFWTCDLSAWKGIQRVEIVGDKYNALLQDMVCLKNQVELKHLKIVACTFAYADRLAALLYKRYDCQVELVYPFDECGEYKKGKRFNAFSQQCCIDLLKTLQGKAL